MSNLPHGLDREVVAAGEQILKQDPCDKASLTILREFMAFAKANNLVRWEPQVHPSEMMVSMFNRNGLMVKASEVHSKFKRIFDAGVDIPDNAYAFEHCPIQGDPLHDVQMEMMRNLTARANGMLAPMTGRERFCRIAASRREPSTHLARRRSRRCNTMMASLSIGAWRSETMGSKTSAVVGA
jgi:hypothetical protein